MKKPKPFDDDEPKSLKKIDTYVRYSTFGIQIVFIVLAFTYLGHLADKHFDTSKPYWTGGLALFGCAGAVYYIIKKFS